MTKECSFDQSWKSMYDSDVSRSRRVSSYLRSTRRLLKEAYRMAWHVVNLMRDPGRLNQMILSISEFSNLTGAQALNQWLEDRFGAFATAFKGFSHRDLIDGIKSGKLTAKKFLAGYNPALLRIPLPSVRFESAAREPVPAESDPERMKKLETLVKRLQEEIKTYRPYVRKCSLLEKEMAMLRTAMRRLERLEARANKDDDEDVA